jgi:hypothetical protein
MVHSDMWNCPRNSNWYVFRYVEQSEEKELVYSGRLNSLRDRNWYIQVCGTVLGTGISTGTFRYAEQFYEQYR